MGVAQLSLVYLNPSAICWRVFLLCADLPDKTSLPVCDRQRCLLSLSHSVQVNLIPDVETEGQ